MAMNWFTRHCYDTDNPQTYGQHFRVAFSGSLGLIGAGLAGLVHAIVPPVFQFRTANAVIGIYHRHVLGTGRHGAELSRYGLTADGQPLTPGSCPGAANGQGGGAKP